MSYHPNCPKCKKEMTIYRNEDGVEVYGVNYCKECKIILS